MQLSLRRCHLHLQSLQILGPKLCDQALLRFWFLLRPWLRLQLQLQLGGSVGRGSRLDLICKFQKAGGLKSRINSTGRVVDCLCSCLTGYFQQLILDCSCTYFARQFCSGLHPSLYSRVQSHCADGIRFNRFFLSARPSGSVDLNSSLKRTTRQVLPLVQKLHSEPKSHSEPIKLFTKQKI